MVIAWITASLVIAQLGKKTTWGFWGVFFCSLLLTPIIGLVAVIALPKTDPKSRPQRGYLTGGNK